MVEKIIKPEEKWKKILTPEEHSVTREDVAEPPLETAIFGGGCFWGIEAAFSHIKGVSSVTSGYSGGKTVNPTYEEVSNGRTGHAETVKIEYRPEIVDYDVLLHIFFKIHDPTSLNRQGADTGTQYRSIIIYMDESQKKIAEKTIQGLKGEYDSPIVTELSPFSAFYPAENYHQDYFKKNPKRHHTVAP